MASFQSYPHFASNGQNKGTLTPGQTIQVNSMTVQVERYLSQGGFAHVYLVKTPAPVNGTHHHVLKRIAVANEAMLSEVQQEIQVMKALKGHPNIVYFIDAQTHRLSNGTFEVFILMEFCPGGGIIDMMNRRLRERLTEAEILQIFVDICEGVAFMHNQRPPILHRDLKVENVLQASPVSYKLCDFGSAAHVRGKVPTTMQEVQAVEADLNRHTTLQYRAPEMVDPFSRRVIDEKSDVWALGVLLYKLCYYTTPFEEHGPLAILNVQYKIPPYPVYSPHMNMLIGSLLREHGAQRPSVFELLANIHRLRGTQSPFRYAIPTQQPIPPRQPQSQRNPLEGTVTYRSQARSGAQSQTSQTAINPSPKNAGIQAREHVLEAIAPMRRGRPTALQEQETETKPWSGSNNDTNTNGDWASPLPSRNQTKPGLEDAWVVKDSGKTKQRDQGEQVAGFQDDFSTLSWNTPKPGPTSNSAQRANAGQLSSSHLSAIMPRSAAFTGSDTRISRPAIPIPAKGRDAFDGLGLGVSLSEKPTPTLGEARKLRTGLATLGSNSNYNDGYSRKNMDKPGSNTTIASRLTPSPRSTFLAPTQLQAPSGASTSGANSSWRSSPQTQSRPNSSARQGEGLSVEARFPSLEDLDATFEKSSGQTKSGPSHERFELDAFRGPSTSLARQTQPKTPSTENEVRLKPLPLYGGQRYNDGVRSEQVTGYAMRESKEFSNKGVERRDELLGTSDKRTNPPLDHISRSTAMPRPQPDAPSFTGAGRDDDNHLQLPNQKRGPISSYASPVASPKPSPRRVPTDWLSGDGESPVNPTRELPIVRDSPSKRASIIRGGDFGHPAPETVQHDRTSPKRQPSPVSRPKPHHASTSTFSTSSAGITRVLPLPPLPSASQDGEKSASPISPTLSKFNRNFPPIDLSESPRSTAVDLPPPPRSPANHKFSYSEKLNLREPRSVVDGDSDVQKSTTQPSKKPQRQGRQSSVHDLVDLYETTPKDRDREKLGVSTNADLAGLDVERSPLDVARRPENVERFSPSKSTTFKARAPSPQPLLSWEPVVAPTPQFTSKPPSTSEASNVPETSLSPSRSRPKSMFMFPSPSAEGSTSHNNLMPPEQPKARTATRRLSISDMVQRYEAIGGSKNDVSPSSAVPTPNAVKLVGLRPTNTSRENGRAGTTTETFTSMTRLPVPNDNATYSQGSSDAQRTSPIGSRTSPSDPSATFERLRKPSRPVQPVRKPSVTTEEGTGTSPPEQPFQGVSRLIDQWQRKTAEADAGPIKRSNIPVKRAGVVGKGP